MAFNPLCTACKTRTYKDVCDLHIMEGYKKTMGFAGYLCVSCFNLYVGSKILDVLGTNLQQERIPHCVICDGKDFLLSSLTNYNLDKKISFHIECFEKETGLKFK
jgi:uncharacterized protein YdaL